MANEKVLYKVLDGRRKYLSKIQGCLIGGAAGDALGYTVEFMQYRDIRLAYGPTGITEYELTAGKALISDDTQMTLFTANGLLYGETRMIPDGLNDGPHDFLMAAYADWLSTQDPEFKPEHSISWLLDIPDLYARRAPGTTCLAVLESGKTGSLDNQINDRCGCGGVMRVAPVGLFFAQYYDSLSDEDLVRYGADCAAITHGHPWGYIPAGMMALIIKKAVLTDDPLKKIIRDSMDVARNVFGLNSNWEEYEELIDKAMKLTDNNFPDQENIAAIGEGWLAHETMAIALYAAVRYEHDFNKALIAAVNHSGDSDSTGAVCGNILGAYLGMNAIDEKWLEKLELRETILEIATDLCDHFQGRSGEIEDPAWMRKYAR